jgi:hypothetical protein
MKPGGDAAKSVSDLLDGSHVSAAIDAKRPSLVAERRR